MGMEDILDCDNERPLFWMGSAYRDLCAFPAAARREAGYNLGLVQNGLKPHDVKPLEQVGPGACELRIGTDGGGGNQQHRVLYLARFPEAVYVLSAFPKKSQKTPHHEVALARRRYAEVLLARREHSPTRRS